MHTEAKPMAGRLSSSQCSQLACFLYERPSCGIQFATGQWIGIELDEPRGKNDGSVNDVRYFECSANHGLFVKDAQVEQCT